MGIVAFVLFVFGIGTWLVRRGRGGSGETSREVGARIGRSIHGAMPIRGLAGQSSNDLVSPHRAPDEIGPEDAHVVRLGDAALAEPEDDGVAEDARRRLDAVLAKDATAMPRRRRRRRPS
jgi:hypothetical protein